MNKRFLLPLLTAAIATTAAPALAAAPAAAGPTETYQVAGMVCNGCVQTVTTKLKSVAGVKAVRVDFKSRTATVTFANAKAKSGYQKLNQSLQGAFQLKPASKPAQP